MCGTMRSIVIGGVYVATSSHHGPRTDQWQYSGSGAETPSGMHRASICTQRGSESSGAFDGVPPRSLTAFIAHPLSALPCILTYSLDHKLLFSPFLDRPTTPARPTRSDDHGQRNVSMHCTGACAALADQAPAPARSALRHSKYYDLLEVSPDASEADLKKAYRKK